MEMGGVLTETKLITGDELWAMGDIGPCELLDGRIMPMSPTGGRHGQLEARLGRYLADFVESNGLGSVVVGEAGIYIRRNPDRVRGVDVAFFSIERLPDGLPDGFIEAAPDLVVEIMSPHDSWQEVRQKVGEYFSIGTGQVWVVEPQNRAVVVFRSGTELQTLNEGETLAGEGALAGFALALSDLFAG